MTRVVGQLLVGVTVVVMTTACGGGTSAPDAASDAGYDAGHDAAIDAAIDAQTTNPDPPDVYQDFEIAPDPMVPRTPDQMTRENGCFGNSFNGFYKRDICVSIVNDEMTDAISEQSNVAWSGEIVPPRAGQHSLRHALIPTHPSQWPAANLDPTNRVEITPKETNSEDWPHLPLSGEERWYGFSVYFPSSFVFAPPELASRLTFIFAQWQDAAPTYPALALHVTGDAFECVQAVGPTFTESHGVYHDCGVIERGQWIDWVVRVVWHRTAGVVQVWKDGSLILDEDPTQTIHYDDANGDPVDNGGRMKMGIYHWRWKIYDDVVASLNAGITDRELFLDEARLYRGADGYDVVKPRF